MKVGLESRQVDKRLIAFYCLKITELLLEYVLDSKTGKVTKRPKEELSDFYELLGGLRLVSDLNTTTKSKNFSNQVRRFYSILKESKLESECSTFNPYKTLEWRGVIPN